MSLSQLVVGPSLPCIFYKLMVASILEDNKLKLPNKFVKKFRDELSSFATVFVPGGRRLLVELMKDKKRVWIVNGWNEFVKNYSICIGYFLVFKYIGNSHFDVHVYNLNDAEINYQELGCNPHLQGKKYKNSTCLHQENDLPELQETSRSTRDRGVQSSGVEVTATGGIKQEAEPEVTDEHESLLPKFKVKGELIAVNTTIVPWRPRDVRTEGKQNAFHAAASMFNPENRYFVQVAELPKLNKSGRKKRKFNHTEQGSSAGQENNSQKRIRHYESASARRRTVTDEERGKALAVARSYEPAYPFFRVILRPSYLYRGCIMYLPSCFAEKYLSGVSEYVKLQVPDGRQWSVRCVYREGKAKFSQGWYEFALANNLGEGDVCTFELLESTEFVLKVTIFRVTENAGLVHKS